MTPRNSPKTPKTGNPGPEIPRAPFRGQGKNGENFRGGIQSQPLPWLAPQAAYIAHTLDCPTCTAAHRWPGAVRCASGAQAWAAYLLALPHRAHSHGFPFETETDRAETEPINPTEENLPCP